MPPFWASLEMLLDDELPKPNPQPNPHPPIGRKARPPMLFIPEVETGPLTPTPQFFQPPPQPKPAALQVDRRRRRLWQDDPEPAPPVRHVPDACLPEQQLEAPRRTARGAGIAAGAKSRSSSRLSSSSCNGSNSNGGGGGAVTVQAKRQVVRLTGADPPIHKTNMCGISSSSRMQQPDAAVIGRPSAPSFADRLLPAARQDEEAAPSHSAAPHAPLRDNGQLHRFLSTLPQSPSSSRESRHVSLTCGVDLAAMWSGISWLVAGAAAPPAALPAAQGRPSGASGAYASAHLGAAGLASDGATLPRPGSAMKATITSGTSPALSSLQFTSGHLQKAGEISGVFGTPLGKGVYDSPMSVLHPPSSERSSPAEFALVVQ